MGRAEELGKVKSDLWGRSACHLILSGSLYYLSSAADDHDVL